jgi:lactoylglutathione lyase
MVYPILFVDNQDVSTKFYSKLLNIVPSLWVPGMTEFSQQSIPFLGIMPRSGIKRLLPSINLPNDGNATTHNFELYFLVEDVTERLNCAIELGAQIISPAQTRDWGHTVAYVKDFDGYIIALAQHSLG